MKPDFLHRHTGKELRLGLDLAHVIVDKPDWLTIQNYIDTLPLSADGAHLMPGGRAFTRSMNGEIYPVIVEMVGLRAADYIQVRHADMLGPQGPWLVSASKLVVSPQAAAKWAREAREAQEAQEAREARDTWVLAQARDAERATRAARKAERETREAMARDAEREAERKAKLYIAYQQSPQAQVDREAQRCRWTPRP
jgi:hypothetical protein